MKKLKDTLLKYTLSEIMIECQKMDYSDENMNQIIAKALHIVANKYQERHESIKKDRKAFSY